MGFLSWFRRKKPLADAINQRERMILSASEPEEELFSLQGRQYVRNAPYLLPKDLQEVNRLDFQHYMLRYAMKGNYLAPLENPAHILDVGCGTGRWTIEVATTFPRSRVLGVDLVQPEPQTSAVPRNCTFDRANALEGLPFEAGSFDYVHQRALTLAFPVAHWPRAVNELLRVTRPGGWVELIEPDFNPQEFGPESQRLVGWLEQACQVRGLDIRVGRHLESFALQAGLLNINKHEVMLPIGNWGGRLGNMVLTDFQAGIAALRQMVTTLAGVNPAEYDRAAQIMWQECETYQHKSRFAVVFGQKSTW